MATKLSEKKLLAGLILLAGAIYLVVTTTLTASPVRISEKGLLLLVSAAILFILSCKLFSRAVQKS